MRFFTIITSDHWSPKNNLHAEVLKVARRHNKKIIPSLKHVAAFRKELEEDLAYSNANHPRCKPMTLSFWQPGSASCTMGHFVASIPGVFNMSIHEEQL